MKIKIIGILFCLISLFSLSGCLKKIEKENCYDYLTFFNIEDFVIEIHEGKKYNDVAYYVWLENLSDFDIIEPIIYYSIDDTKEFSNLFDDYVKKYQYFFNDDRKVEDIILVGDSNQLIKSNERANEILLSLGTDAGYWNDIPNKKQIDVMKISSLEFKFASKENNLYLATYDFNNNVWNIEDIDSKINNYQESKMLKDFPIPSVEYNRLINNEKEVAELVSYNVSRSYFNKYIKIIKKIGYTENSSNGTNINYYSAKNENGMQIFIRFEEESKTMYVKLKK